MTLSVDLSEKIKAIISESGPMPVSEFMRIALRSYHNSYYVADMGIGKRGDFITAPEISQIFGEIIGVWCANYWQLAGKPKNFNLIELGPGKGTLMSDLLRATKGVDDFHKNINISLVEINHQFKEIQKSAINHHSVNHYESYDQIEPGFSIIVANEFFDALPINQYIKKKDKWFVNMVDLNSDRSHLCINYYDANDNIRSFLSNQYNHIPDEGIIEINDEANILIKKITKNIMKYGGAVLIIDYGYTESTNRNFISTLQSVKNHKFHPLFKEIGSADLTSHINFTNLYDTAKIYDGVIHGPVTQRDFLLRMGADLRRDLLIQNAKTSAAKKQILSGYERLTCHKQMGDLFKVMAITNHQVVDIGF